MGPILIPERVTGIEPVTTAWKAVAIPFCNTRKSGRPDLNRRPLRPKRSALAVCATPRKCVKYTAFKQFRQGKIYVSVQPLLLQASKRQVQRVKLL